MPCKIQDGRVVNIGDVVEFKYDVEQQGRVVKIVLSAHLDKYLELEGHFVGDYIGGDTKTTQRAEDCW